MKEEEEENLSERKRQKYVKKCKNVARRRWQREYVTALYERHNMQHNSKAVNINVGDVVMIKDEIKKRRKWKIGIISELFQDKDDQIQDAQVKTPRGYLDRPIQLLCPLELHCNRCKIKSKQHESDKKKLNVEAKEFRLN